MSQVQYSFRHKDYKLCDPVHLRVEQNSSTLLEMGIVAILGGVGCGRRGRGGFWRGVAGDILSLCLAAGCTYSL